MSADPSFVQSPLRRPAGPRPSFQQAILIVCMVASGGMLTAALIALFGDAGLFGYLKIFFCVLGGMAVSYGVNRCALDRGAPLAVVGYKSAGVVSVLAILVVGAGLFAASYAGLVLKDVDQLRLEAHGATLTEHASVRAGDTAQGAAIAPILTSIADDLEKKAACERAGSCVSGRANGGRGPVTRTLETMATRARGIAAQFDAGMASGANKSADIAGLLGRYGSIAAGTESLAEKRTKLQAIDAQVRQALAARKEAAPLALAAAYAVELQAGGTIPGQPEATRSLSAILQNHAQSLRAGTPPSEAAPAAPAFPKQAGVADTFAYIGHFAPIAAITAVVELIFPLVLWIYVALTHLREIDRLQPRAPRPRHEDDEAGKRILGGTFTASRSRVDRDAIDPDAYFRGFNQRWANGDDRHGGH